MILVAESGSTKCDWVLIDLDGREIERWSTMGFNPYFHSSDKVFEVLTQTSGLSVWADKITQTWFYGAGCSSAPMREVIKKGLDRVFTNAANHVDHDLNASAYALYTGEPVIACILGTGSNSCFYDGKTVREEVPALAYILGDEGSASFIGKRLLADYLYKKLPKELMVDFDKTYKTTKEEIFDRVYNQPNANVYLASFGPFAGKHKDNPHIKALVRDGIRKFIDVHVKCYPESTNVKVSFVGSVAKAFEDIIREELAKDNLKFGRVLAKPVNNLIAFHIDFLDVLNHEKA
jgi:N-acetylglucosamine kinase-like BadF-type ATPase